MDKNHVNSFSESQVLVSMNFAFMNSCFFAKQMPTRRRRHWLRVSEIEGVFNGIELFVCKLCVLWCVDLPVEIYTPTYVSPNMHMTCLLLAQDTQVKIVCVSDLLVIIAQSGSGALAPVTGFLGKWSQWTWKLSWMSWISEWCNSRRCLAKRGKERPHWKRD